MIDSIRKWYFLSKHLDNRNQKLWTEVSKQYDITIRSGYEPNYSVFIAGRQATIYIPKGGTDPGSFAHELLHIYLHSKGIAAGRTLYICVLKKPQLRSLLSAELLEFLSNSLDHLKMLPLFLDLGYKPYQFITDYATDKGSDQLINPIVTSFMVGNHHNKVAFDSYIGRYFSIVACPNCEYNYSRALELLKSLDADLFAILERFALSWKDLEPTGDSHGSERRKLIGDQVVEELNGWITNKTFC